MANMGAVPGRHAGGHAALIPSETPAVALVCGGTAGERARAGEIFRRASWEVLDLRSLHELRDLEAPERVSLCLIIAGDDPVGAVQVAVQTLPGAGILVTGPEDVRLAVATVRAGATDYLPRLELESLLERAARRRSTPITTSKQLFSQVRKSDHLIGVSPAIQEVLHLLDRACRTDIPVLISGESGTGKELAARLMHFGGPRAKKPFVAVNCAAVTEALVEAKLFGHTKGAFTGALGPKRGLFEEANGGTLLLDEIGEASPSLQTKLLRVVESGEVTRVGDTRPRPIDVRILSATNRDLTPEVGDGGFRKDLYYRLSAFPVHMPPLRECPDDIPLLALHFLRMGGTGWVGPRRITPPALQRLLTYDWPGNARELRNVLARAVVMCDEDRISPEDLDLPNTGAPVSDSVPSFRDAKRTFEAEYIRQVLAAAQGVVTRAAKLAGKERKDFYVLMRRHDIDPAAFRPPAAG